ncbi:MAG: SusC/RagA family TonB-linked outer membrane protein [Bacteroidetes bacterium]|nr:SusC/RagA family TonB-linked outer membrane protein [Bacteroidota bacterium]
MKKILLILFSVICCFFHLEAYSQETTITGVVTDGTTNETLVGVNIVIEGTTVGAITNMNGSYSITVPSPDATLVFSFLGYTTQTAVVGARLTIDIQLMPSLIGLDEIVVIGYGTQRRGSITGAISSVSSDDILELPVTDAGSALQGRATGVVALSAGNQPGEGVTIRIRGRRSLTATNEPLYVVDGIPYDGNIADINPRDIKSMEILKDASATAIYGSRGANGVILITTKRGGNFATTVSYTGHYGISSVLGIPDMMTGDEYYTMKEVGGRAFTADELDAYAAGVSTDWMNLVLDKGYQQNHQLSVRGGSAKTGFALSANYFNEVGVIEIQDYTRSTFRVNLDHKVSERIRIGTSTQVSNAVQNWASNPYGTALALSPLAEPYDASGEIIYRPGADPLLWNALSDYVEGNIIDERATLRVFSNIFAELDILKNLTYRLNFGPDFREYRQGLFQGTNSISRQGGVPRVQKQLSRTYNYTFENILTYNLNIDNHNLNVTGLYSIQQSTGESTNIWAENIPYESQMFHNIGTAETVLEFGSDLSEWGIMSFMGRVNYEFMGKYMLTVTGRYDGSSRLAEGNKWGFFPSAALMWRISNEDFMSTQTLFSDLRLRASYGVTGNTGISPYQTRGSLSRTIYSFGGNAGYGYAPGALANPELRWESSTTANVGLDFGLMENRISGSFELYQTRTTDLLLERQIPITSGFNSVFENIGETMNKGWELALVTRNIATGDFKWETTLNLFGNKEEIIDLYGTETDDIGNQWFIGEPLTVWYDYDKVGIWQTGEADEAAVYTLEPGDIKVRDVNNDNKINQDDRVIIGSDMPTVTIGLGSRFEYKGVDFSFLLLGVFGHTIYNDFEVDNSTLQGRYNNLDVDYWTETNPTNAHPKPDGSVEYPLYSSSRGYYPGDYFKIKNIQLGYSLPKSTLSKVGIKKLRVYVNLDTPYIWSNLANNLDPEIYGGEVEDSDVPSTRMYSFGVMLDF